MSLHLRSDQLTEVLLGQGCRVRGAGVVYTANIFSVQAGSTNKKHSARTKQAEVILSRKIAWPRVCSRRMFISKWNLCTITG
jgi:hypothetical protein